MSALPYSPFVRAGDWVVISGQVGAADGALAPGGLDGEIPQMLANLQTRLDEAGIARTDIVKCLVFLTDMADFPTLNTAYAEWFGDHRPARSCVAVAALPFGACVEIEAWAYAPV